MRFCPTEIRIPLQTSSKQTERKERDLTRYLWVQFARSRLDLQSQKLRKVRISATDFPFFGQKLALQSTIHQEPFFWLQITKLQ